jgi:hypothetical protein
VIIAHEKESLGVARDGPVRIGNVESLRWDRKSVDHLESCSEMLLLHHPTNLGRRSFK